MITVKGFVIASQGDSSVGIFPQSYKLVGPFDFEDEFEVAAFKNSIRKVFVDYCVDGAVFVTEDEKAFTDFHLHGEKTIRKALETMRDYMTNNGAKELASDALRYLEEPTS